MKKIAALLFVSQFGFAQIVLKGKVIEEGTNQPVSFASVGVKSRTYGTVCDENGNFELKVGTFLDSDTLKISAIGYQAKGFLMNKAKSFTSETIILKPGSIQLSEVKVKPGKTVQKTLGNKNYNENICMSFQGPEGSWKGTEVSIKANNKKGRLVFIEDFNFYIVKNLYKDSLTFRLNFYKEDKDGMPGENILRKPIIFKTKVRSGIVSIKLKDYFINCDDDFFISLECLEEKIDKDVFCFSGALLGPSYAKMSTFSDWVKLPVGGVDLNVTVTYQK
jgi:hypothetical protein